MEYSAGSVKYLLWFIETRETARLLKDHSPDEVKSMVLSENIYQQKDRSRLISEYGCIIRRLNAIPSELVDLMLQTDVSTARIIVLISAMASDRALYELMYEVYREKLRLGEDEFTDVDFVRFFDSKAEQNGTVASWTDATRRKLRQVYSRMLAEAGLLRLDGKRRYITRPYIDISLRDVMCSNGMEQYISALTGER